MTRQQQSTTDLPHTKESEQKLYIIFQPFVQITYHKTHVIQRQATYSISYTPTQTQLSNKQNFFQKNKPTNSTQRISNTSQKSAGLDCSGQGECQPDIENSDSVKMQRFLVKANRKNNLKRRHTDKKNK